VDTVRALEWAPSGALRILDQTRLPGEERWLELDRVESVVEAIRSLRVRGAPAIGVAAAMGLAAALLRSTHLPRERFLALLDASAAELVRARPTAVNLAWAVERARAAAHDAAGGTAAAFEALHAAAEAIRREDEAMCRAIGEAGQSVLQVRQTTGRLEAGGGSGLEAGGGGRQDGEPIHVLTHCNAGALATAGIGTALAIVYVAHERGVLLHVWVDETRPLLQGSRLSAWELGRAGIAHTVLPDGAAASLMQAGNVDLVLVGADRIARNGDAANKIGTYPLAIAARAHGIPFYVVAPSSTFDPATPTGAEITIEQRAAAEVTRPFGLRTAPEGTAVYNPAFDVTPASLITGWISERGQVVPPF
jgi:methylthioribose-1-phosphate isomerase